MEKKFGIAAKAIIKNEEGKFLVLFKSKDEDINPNEIDIPGGRIEFGEEAAACLEREVREETNLDIRIGRPSRIWHMVKENLHLLGITFAADLVGGDIKLSGEHDAYRWMAKEDIINGDYPKWIKKEFSELP
jgi:8-oxo-dGTP diphosphatase